MKRLRASPLQIEIPCSLKLKEAGWRVSLPRTGGVKPTSKTCGPVEDRGHFWASDEDATADCSVFGFHKGAIENFQPALGFWQLETLSKI